MVNARWINGPADTFNRISTDLIIIIFFWFPAVLPSPQSSTSIHNLNTWPRPSNNMSFCALSSRWQQRSTTRIQRVCCI
ncbi:hypothetical protein EYF80_039591 [Liparis tanakae]|uniref:Uncharacterized protein n=1 Tax=Liparis tanakae TaxID=230148 RepID=A0A4Z2G9P2_9TELE|nr:hypothetical protein EYF80_039591 [Liparis tanakae]